MIDKQPLTGADLQNLASSFITPELAKRAGLFRVDSITGAEMVGQLNKAGREDFSGLAFPYFLPENPNPVEYRLRRDNPPMNLQPDGTHKETAKYLTPAGRGNLLYFPPDCQKMWLADDSLPVVITEGEKKTIALVRAAWHGLGDAADKPRFLALGLQGVWNFRGQVAKIPNSRGKRVSVKGLIADFRLSEWHWKNRKVTILFDSNTATNPNVAQARRNLAKELRILGADVYFADLPEIDNCNGIDDVLGKIEREENENAAIKFLFDLLDQASANDSTVLQMASAFEEKADGVYFIDENGHGLKICSPLKVLAETQTEAGENYGRLLEWHDSQNRRHVWAMPIELVHSDSNEHIKYLVSRGLEVIPSRKNREKVSLYLATSKPPETIICTDKTGWHGNLFVLPDASIGQTTNGAAQVIFQSANSFEHRFRTKGTLNQWRDHIARKCAGNSRLVFAVSTAFASCLLSILREDGGGFHFRGSSSLGKSTALLVAGSIWGGDARRGFLNTWRTTANGLEAVAELHNDGLLLLDELKECEPKTAGEVAYMLANGQGKGRMTRNVSARRSLSWNLLFLSSGELSLSDVVSQNGGRVFGGQEVRMCDIEADAGEGFGLFENLHQAKNAELFAKELQENSRRFYGTAIREFLEDVSPDFENIKSQWTDFRQEFMQSVLPTDASGEVQRVAARFALVAFGGMLASDICGWHKLEAFESCKKVFKTWLDARTHGNADADAAVSQVRHFLEAHGESRFQTLRQDSNGTIESDSNNRTIINRVGFKRITDDKTEFLILPESFRKEVCKGFDAKIVIRELHARNFLMSDQDKFQKTERLPEIGVKKVYAVSSDIFETGNAANVGGIANANITF